MFNRIAIKEENNLVVNTINARDEHEFNIPDQLICQLDDTSPRLRPIIDKFVIGLADKVANLDEAVDNNFDEIEKFAAWLKASAGSVGFNDFTAPARELQEMAKAQQIESVSKLISVIRKMESRIVLSDDDMNTMQEQSRA